jgi:hypothetical protein
MHACAVGSRDLHVTLKRYGIYRFPFHDRHNPRQADGVITAPRVGTNTQPNAANIGKLPELSSK